MTTDEFKEQALIKNKYYKEGYFDILGEYVNMKIKILLKDEYSFHRKTPEHILRGENVALTSSTDFKEYIYNFLVKNSKSFSIWKDGLLDIIKENNLYYCIIKTNYGICKITNRSLLNNYHPSIKSAVNKTEYFINQLKEIDNGITDYSNIKYIKSNKKVIYGTKYGLCQMTPNRLLSCDRADTLKSAVNKTEYIKNIILLERGDEYDLSLIDYKNNLTPVKIGCKLHGVFEVPTCNFIGSKSYRGCPKCGRESTKEHNINNPIGWSHEAWTKAGKISKYFDSYKVYILECWDDKELFYKIGRTFLKVNRRFRSNKMPYDYKVLYEFLDYDGKFICNLEKEIKNSNKNNKYVPNIEFEGMYECFSKLEDLTGFITLCRDRQNK
jgi:hypothetical protein